MNSSLETWRFINSGFLDGATNMAIDLALARCMFSTSHYPILRIYGWNPPAISLGYHQKLNDIDVPKCMRDGIDVVYRPTGGRAILHAEELTYAVILPKSSRYYFNEISKVYEIISLCLTSALNQLNLNVKFERAQMTPANFSRGELSTMCYASTIQHEISHEGKKLVGSAQRRFDNVVLQHGSILIGNKHLDLVNYLSNGEPQRHNRIRDFLQSKTICLNDINQTDVSFSTLTGVIKNGFENELDIKFLDTELTKRELETVREIARQEIQKTIS